MAWIKSEQSLANHPKLKAFARDLGISEVEALGHLHLMWYWVLEYADTGLVTKHIDFLPEAMKWEKSNNDLIEALIIHGFIDRDDDGSLRIHDWYDYSGNFVEKRLYNRIKKQESRDRIVEKEEKLDDLTSFDESLTSFDKSLTFFDGQDPEKTRLDKTRQEENIGLATQDEVVIQAEVVDNSKRDLIFETLATVCGYDWKGVMTKDERGRINRAVKQLKDIGATPEDIELRAKNFVLSYGFNPAPQSITSLYSKLSKPQPKLTKKQLEEVQKQAVNQGRWDQLKEKYDES
jgi:hypothetical protein